ncbi:formate dehydrogenase subunit delta [Xanthobacter dioxanivorans]|uniref:Formate dehydrogenase subunit delta n=1 Tax=Xanthobacter dioxanivorans TaxID=2528964 RepID=A0A974SI12_9HYPH|nr:formate dehydrogenase subunit delta [Xanthobacter dioxanivorans]QRG04913.1 formate dehydrogenase subunit delta [Xanthobacter dioxanivorans]
MSHSTAEKLVYMANQIATAFSMQKHEAAVEATRIHIQKFWDPRMRAKIAEHIAHGGEGLSPIAREALDGLRPAKAA